MFYFLFIYFLLCFAKEERQMIPWTYHRCDWQSKPQRQDCSDQGPQPTRDTFPHLCEHMAWWWWEYDVECRPPHIQRLAAHCRECGWNSGLSACSAPYSAATKRLQHARKQRQLLNQIGNIPDRVWIFAKRNSHGRLLKVSTGLTVLPYSAHTVITWKKKQTIRHTSLSNINHDECEETLRPERHNTLRPLFVDGRWTLRQRNAHTCRDTAEGLDESYRLSSSWKISNVMRRAIIKYAQQCMVLLYI